MVPETQGPGKVLKGFIKTTQSHIAVRFILWIFINNKGVNYHMNITACDLVQSDLVQSAAWDKLVHPCFLCESTSTLQECVALPTTCSRSCIRTTGALQRDSR